MRNLADFVRRNPGCTIGEVMDGVGYPDAAACWEAVIDANRAGTISMGKIKEPGTWRIWPVGDLPDEYELRM